MTREEILKAVFALFESEGIRSFNMRKIAERLGMGKWDLYDFFDDKRTLVSKSIEYGIQQLDDELEEICRKHVNPLEMLIRSAVVAFDTFDKMKQVFLDDVDEYPEAIDTILHEAQRIQRQQPAIFHQAVEEGYMIGDLYYKLLERFFWQNYMAQNEERGEAMRVLFTVLRGAATEKGRQTIEYVRKEMDLNIDSEP